jgi:hypothetical protein
MKPENHKMTFPEFYKRDRLSKEGKLYDGNKHQCHLTIRDNWHWYVFYDFWINSHLFEDE